jgi:hypothetical protein
LYRHFVLTGVAVGFLILGVPQSAQAQPRHHRLHVALHELREARAELLAAKHKWGGHREKAIEGIDGSIRNIEAALRARGDNVKGIAPGAEVYKKYKRYPHIHHAIDAVQLARTEMLEAKHNWGGHRDAAIRDMDFALKHLRLCLENAR